MIIKLDPDKAAAEWHSRIEKRADDEVNSGITVTVGGTDYGIRTDAAALAFTTGGAVAADRARGAGETITEPVPTDKGVIDFDADGLDAIFDAARMHRRAIIKRVRELHGKVKDGTITFEDLDTGWNP